MISYMAENKDRLLFRLNPFIKIIILVLVTVIITFDYMPYVPGIFLFTILTLTWIFGGIPLSRLLTILAPFLAVSLGFIIFTLLSTGLQVNAAPDVTILNFGWSYKNIYISLSLGLRILAIVSFSVSFVLTTNPVELIISLIKYFRLPCGSVILSWRLIVFSLPLKKSCSKYVLPTRYGAPMRRRVGSIRLPSLSYTPFPCWPRQCAAGRGSPMPWKAGLSALTRNEPITARFSSQALILQYWLLLLYSVQRSC